MKIRNWTWRGWIFLIAGAAVVLRLLSFYQTSFANGWDSYFYLVQLKSWSETGRMHSPEASLIYPVMRFFYWLSGDYVEGYKWCAAVLAGVWVWVVGSFSGFSPTSTPTPPQGGRGVCSQQGHLPSPPGEGLGLTSGRSQILLASWYLFSPHLTYFAAQYPKNLLGLILLLAFIRSLPDGKSLSAKSLAIPAFLLIINYFGHRQTFALALVYLVLWLLTAFRSHLRVLLLSRTTLIVAATAVLVAAGAAWLAPGLFHPADLQRLSGALGLRPQFTPWSFVRDFGLERISACWLAEIGAALTLLSVGCWKLATGRLSADRHRLALVFCLLLLFPFLEWSLTGAAYRFFLVFVLLVPALCLDMLSFSPGISRLMTAGLLVGSLFSWKGYDPKRHDPDYRLFSRITTVARSDSTFRASGPELVIAPNALAEVFTFTTGIDALPWLPEYPIEPRRLWRIAVNMREPEVEYYSGAKVRRLPGNYLLLYEGQWQKALDRARGEGDADFVERATNWPNPARVRPGYLLRRKTEF